MVQRFYSAIVALHDKCLPVTEHQHADSMHIKWAKSLSTRLSNQIQRLGKKLRLNYYKNKVDHLYLTDQQTW